MKRLKLFFAMLCVAVLFACGGVFAACGENEPQGGQQGETPGGSETPGGETPGGSETPGGETPGGSETPGGETPGGETPGGELFPQGYRGTWKLTSSGGSVLITIEIAADGMKFNGEAVTAEKNGGASAQESYSFTAAFGQDSAFSFSLTGDGYAILLTQTVEEEGEEFSDTYTLISDGFVAPDLSAPTGYAGTWTDEGQGEELRFSQDGKIFFGDEPVTLLTLNAEGTYATAFCKLESMTCWMEFTFGEEEISVSIPNFGEYSFLPASAEETISFPEALWGSWAELGAEDGHTFVLSGHAVLFDGQDVTGATIYDEEEEKYFFLGSDRKERAFALTKDGYILYMQVSGSDGFTLFGAEEDGTGGMPDLALPEFAGRTYTNKDLGTLAFDEGGKATLEGAAVRVLSKKTEGEPSAEKTAGYSFLCGEMWYEMTIGETFTVSDLNGAAYEFDQALDDLTPYLGEWKHFHPASALDVTVTADTFSYGRSVYTCCVDPNGGTYCKYGVFKMYFGFLGEEKTVFYLAMSAANYFLYTETGEQPSAAFPESFYGAWTDGNISMASRLTVSAGSASIGTAAVEAFAVTGAAGEETVHTLYNGGYWKFTHEDGGIAAEQPGNPQIVHYTKVDTDESLPQEYRGAWTQLGDTTKKAVVDNNGKLTLFGTATPVTTSATGIYQISIGGETYNLELTADGILQIYRTGGDAYYFTKDGATLPDASAAAAQFAQRFSMEGGWTSASGIALTVSAEGAFTADGEAFRFLSAESNTGGWIATLLWKNAWYDLVYEDGVLTLTSATGEEVFSKEEEQGAQAAADTQGGASALAEETKSEEAV